MNAIDNIVVVFYFVFVIGFGLWYRKRAARDLESYFLGSKRIHWSLLSMSGAVSNFDITGTMWMVSVVFLVGMKSWWHFQMAGFMMPAFCFAFMAKWVRRSNVITGAEWMVTRFGHGPGGGIARFAYAILAIVTCVSFIGYAFQGIGKFAQVYVPLEGLAEYLPFAAEAVTTYKAHSLAVIIFSLTTVYIVLGGLVGVVVTDVIQTVILTLAALLVGAIAYQNLTPQMIENSLPTRFGSLEEFTTLMPVWRMEQFAGTAYEFFGAMVVVWVLKEVLLGVGGPAELYDLQRYLAANDPRNAAKVAIAWPFFQSVRWLMVMAITLLALTGVTSTSDPELVMPMVLQDYLPMGLRGLVVAGLLAAFMSSFSSVVNSGASYVVRDIWQPLFRPDADERHLVRFSYLATVGIVIAGIIVGWNATSISSIWNWIMMSLGSAVIIPNALRWYWWRLNGWGYSAGVLGGIVFSLLVPLVPGAPTFVTFPLLCLGSLITCIVGSLVTPPVEEEALYRFYDTVRPFGVWGPVRRHVPELTSDESSNCESPWLAALNTVLGIALISGLYLFPCYLVGHWHTEALTWIGVAVVSSVALYFTWYRNLPPAGEGYGNDA